MTSILLEMVRPWHKQVLKAHHNGWYEVLLVYLLEIDNYPPTLYLIEFDICLYTWTMLHEIKMLQAGAEQVQKFSISFNLVYSAGAPSFGNDTELLIRIAKCSYMCRY